MRMLKAGEFLGWDRVWQRGAGGTRGAALRECVNFPGGCNAHRNSEATKKQRLGSCNWSELQLPKDGARNGARLNSIGTVEHLPQRTKDKVATFFAQHGPEGRPSLPFQHYNHSPLIEVESSQTTVLTHRAEVGRQIIPCPAQPAHTNKNRKAIPVLSNLNFARNGHRAEPYQENAPYQERKAEHRSRNIKVPRQNLLSIDSAQRASRPDAGERHYKKRQPGSGRSAHAKASWYLLKPRSCGRCGEIRDTGRASARNF